MLIPATATALIFSSGRIIKARIAPITGIKNFQKLRSDTFTSGRFKRVNHIEIAVADKKLNQAREA